VKGVIIFLGIVAIVTIVPVSNINSAYAQCKSEADVKAAYDYQLPKYSGSYDPCDNWLE
jgi:hypothetical protein